MYATCRQCSSGLQAIADVAASIKAGYYNIGIGAGVEQMTTDGMSWKGSVNPKVMESQEAQDCLLPMGNLPAFNFVLMLTFHSTCYSTVC